MTHVADTFMLLLGAGACAATEAAAAAGRDAALGDVVEGPGAVAGEAAFWHCCCRSAM